MNGNFIPINSYLINALRQWLIDSAHRPYISVDYIEAGLPFLEAFTNTPQKIILDVSPIAVRSFQCDTSGVSVSCRFEGRPYDLFIPLHAIRTIFSGDAPNDSRFFCPLPDLDPMGDSIGGMGGDEVEDTELKPTKSAKVVSLSEWKKQN